MSEIMYPVAETFYSIQGEATFTGYPMWFLRLAGCNVGKYIKLSHESPEDDYSASPFQILHPEYAICTSFAGEKFVCDTDYRVKMRLTVEDIINQMRDEALNVEFVSITGGEPFIHNLEPLILALNKADIQVNIETSGTKPIQGVKGDFWTVCSPKEGFLSKNRNYINEFKFLVRGPADEAAIMEFVKKHNINDSNIWITPIDEIIATDQGSWTDSDVKRSSQSRHQRQFAVECVKRHPQWKLSPQVHKWLGVR